MRTILLTMLDTDEGARRLGELGSLQLRDQRHMRNTLFDEKIDGTVHLALGRGFPFIGGTNDERAPLGHRQGPAPRRRAAPGRRGRPARRALVDLGPAGDAVERPAVRAPRPLVGAPRLRVARALRVAEREHDGGPRADDSLGGLGVADAVRTRDDTPSFQAASIMFCAARPASNGRFATIATTSAAVLTLWGA
jgi:hypothetical protein